ncbi:FtsB family cell division protein [Mycobacterium shimoidei]|uniref:Septation inhibitor protein n=1 Tax=Mycobacterium shimoidei TaxID=29313 RepID=A0A1E3THY1_MYCSH|nr:septum formation initiator family protein [Mycobacterium shimoidei]MCV7259218.1 septum formation initiator family protein [Mycobacterium shimoidei]ODR13279.1 septation inhibitor protein [Mycobacterium shimoidei]ORW79617.1 septation inhibitor protein [Mycobacterium shimoidei]SRX93922.1 hypothetical protein [Mycobacterium leprae TN] [Mycobacterium shimoidei]
MPEAKRPDPKRRSPAPSRGKPGRAGPRKSTAQARARAVPEVIEPIKRAIVESAEQRSEQRLGLTARRAAILAAVVCVLTLTIAGPVRTYFAQRTEMKQLAASEAALRRQIAELEQQKVKLGDPAYIAAQARERLGFVMPGEVPYQVQLPPSAAVPGEEHEGGPTAANTGPWYTSLWHTIADTPHGPPPPAPPPEPAAPNPAPPGG